MCCRISSHYIVLVLLIGLMASAHTYGQTNPFDLIHRLPTSERASEPSNESVRSPAPAIDTTRMPEDVVKSNPMPPADEEIDTNATVNGRMDDTSLGDTLSNVSAVSPITPTPNQGSRAGTLSLFLTLLISALLTMLTVSVNRQIINRVIRAVLNDNYLNLLYRELKKSGHAIKYLVLVLVFSLNMGLFIHLILSHFYPALYAPLALCILAVMTIYLIRYVVMKYMSYVYPFNREVDQYSFTIIMFNILLGLILLPINVFAAFSPPGLAFIFLIIGLVVVGIALIFRSLRGLFIGGRHILMNKFYFILYLCAVELAPILLILKGTGV